jgi:hypothetical protein
MLEALRDRGLSRKLWIVALACGLLAWQGRYDDMVELVKWYVTAQAGIDVVGRVAEIRNGNGKAKGRSVQRGTETEGST